MNIVFAKKKHLIVFFDFFKTSIFVIMVKFMSETYQHVSINICRCQKLVFIFVFSMNQELLNILFMNKSCKKSL